MKRRRPMDWVCNTESWDLTTPPFVLDPFFIASVGYAHSNAQNCMLTFHKDFVDDLNEVGTPQLEQTAVRVVGDITFGMHTFAAASMPTVNLLLNMHFRVVVGVQTPDALLATDLDQAGYNMDTPWVANDDFLWHHRESTVLSNSYWSEFKAQDGDWRDPVRIPVDIRVQRRLKQREVLSLLMQCSQKGVVAPGGVIRYDPWADLRIFVEPRLRVLVKTIT